MVTELDRLKLQDRLIKNREKEADKKVKLTAEQVGLLVSSLRTLIEISTKLIEIIDQMPHKQTKQSELYHLKLDLENSGLHKFQRSIRFSRYSQIEKPL